MVVIGGRERFDQFPSRWWVAVRSTSRMKRQRGLLLEQVRAQRLSYGLFVAQQVEHVVGDLEGRAEDDNRKRPRASTVSAAAPA